MTQISTKDKYYLNGICSGDAQALEEIYTNYHRAIIDLVKKDGGSMEDAKDLFQEGIMLVYQKATQPQFVLSSSFFTYLFGVCRNLWRNKLSKKRRHGEVTLTEEVKSIYKDDSTKGTEQEESYLLYREKFLLLGQDCQKILSMAFDKRRMKEIMQVMGFASEGYAKKRKFTCKKKLVSLIEQDPRYKELIA